MTEGERVRAMLEHLEHVFPGVGAHFEAGASTCWDEDPSARGAYTAMAPGEVIALSLHIATLEGRIHFAGEHASPWQAWMQGALWSGFRAAREINEST